MFLRIWAVLLLLAAGSACDSAKVVRLTDSSGATEVEYSCDTPELSVDVSAEQRRVILREAGRIINFESDRGNLDRVEPVRLALSSGEFEEVEAAVVDYGCAHGVVGEPVFPEPGSTPPSYQLAVLRGPQSGTPITSDGTSGRPVILMFWATWCPPCRDGYPELQELAQKAWDYDVDVYAVVVDDLSSNVDDWVAEHGGGITFLLDAGGRVRRDFKARGVPSTYVIGAEGKLRLGGVGYGGAETIGSLLEVALAPPS